MDPTTRIVVSVIGSCIMLAIGGYIGLLQVTSIIETKLDAQRAALSKIDESYVSRRELQLQLDKLNLKVDQMNTPLSRLVSFVDGQQATTKQMLADINRMAEAAEASLKLKRAETERKQKSGRY